MNKLFVKVAAGAASAILVGAMFAPSVFAGGVVSDPGLVISGNGKGSDNTIVVTNTSNCLVLQGNATLVLASVSADASTGGNQANGNTGGDVTVSTGAAKATSEMTVTGGNNSATNPCCCAVSPTLPTDPTISGNGNKSTNTIVTTDTKNSAIVQVGITGVVASVKANAQTGKNMANGNTGIGKVNVTSGAGTSKSTLKVKGGSNTVK